ncbi:hypothetical protein [Paenibacillus sp. sgz5001063]|uniref:hypothetical protein n=1 Tax=Paenibacillus sp. sgz5001063 TaxID=3242474 RepID=UPI0036D3EA14
MERNLSIHNPKGLTAMRKVNRVVISTFLLCTAILSTSCSALNDKPAAENLSLVLAGMDGSDGVTFEGASSLLLDGKPVPEAALYYGGTVADHNKVSLYTLLPDSRTPRTAVSGEKKNTLKSSSAGTPAYYSKLEKKNGKWTLLSEKGSAQGKNPLPSLNPISQLEELENLEKKVSEEAGAARGTRVLRIELSEAEANRQLTAELERQMDAIRPEGVTANHQMVDKGLEPLQLLWEKKNNELHQKLQRASVKTVYYLKVDTKRNLPRSLTSSRTVSYPGVREASGNTAEENYLTQVNFYGYR